MAVVSDYTALLSGSSWTSGPAGQAVVLTYSFSGSATSSLLSSNPAAAATFVPLSDAQKSVVRGALAQWSAVSGVTFYETTSTPGDLTFGAYALSTMGALGEAGLGTYPSTGLYLDSNGAPQIYSNFLTQGGDVYFDTGYLSNPAYAADFAHVAIHEIGHALGLKHPFDTAGNTLDPLLDTGAQTVMSYAGLRSATLEPLDVAAIQALYGTKAGTTRPFAESWNAATESLTETGTGAAQAMFGSGGDDVFFSNGGQDAISGGEGDDIVYASGTAISVNGGPGTDTVVTGLTYVAGSTFIGGTGSFRYLTFPGTADAQIYANVERLDFANGVYDLASNSFAAVQPGTYAWTGNVGTTWSTPGNWKAISGGSAAVAPGASDTVVVGGSVSGDGNAAILSLAGTTGFSGSYVVGSLVAGSATAGLQAGTSLSVATGATVAGGLITITGASAVLEIGGHGFATGGSGTLEVDAGGVLSGYGTINAHAIDNNGLIVASGGTLRLIGVQGAPASGSAQIGAGSTLWVQNMSGLYVFQGAGAQLRADTPSDPLQPAPRLSGFGAGDQFVLSGVNPGVAYTQTGAATGTLTAGGTTVVMLGDYSQSAFHATTDSGSNTTTITVSAKAVPADPLFDAAYYLARNPDVRAAGVDPYAHYMAIGWTEGRDPSVLFSSRTYLAQNPDVRAAGVNPLTHYEQSGFKEGRNPDAWFDDRFYLTQNPDVAAAGVNPLVHFLQSGWREGREPSLVFSDAKYLAANPDVRAAGINPLAHYVANGQAEGRAAQPSGGSAPADPLVDAAFYDRQLGATLIPAGPAGAQQAAYSYNNGGWQKGLNPDAWFDTSYYLSHNPDVAAAHINPLTHFENFGWKEGRDASAQFSTGKYLAAYPDVRAAGVDPLVHFVTHGLNEGRTALAV